MTVTVVGLGKIGLPLAVQYALSGEQVIGADVSERVVGLVNAGTEPFPGEADLDVHLADVVSRGRLRATTDTTSAVADSDVVVVVVPLFVDAQDQPDFGWMDSASEDIGRGLTRGTLVLYETTLPVGTTRNRWKPLLERISGLSEGEDFHLAFSPERVLTGRVFADLRKYPKLVGGLSEQGTKQATTFYERVLQFEDRPDLSRPNGVWTLGSAEAAELAKLAETTYRDVNIALANEFAKFAAAEEIDILSVIDACNSQPYSHLHHPGIAVGGHCIPVYPRLYLWNNPGADLVRTARAINAGMPETYVQLAEQNYGDLHDARVLILGIAYRGNVKEHAYSGAFALKKVLASKGAIVTVADPLYSADEISSLGFRPENAGDTVDIAILQADHPEYDQLDPDTIGHARLIIDGRPRMNRARSDAAPVIGFGTVCSRIGNSPENPAP